MVAGPPEEDVDHVAVPAAAVDVAEGRAIRPVWVNERGGVTFAVGERPVACFVKWAPAGSGLDLTAEAARMAWAVAYTPVPAILGEGADATLPRSTGSWCATVTPAPRTPSSTKAGGRATSTSAPSGWPTAGPTSPSPPGARS